MRICVFGAGAIGGYVAARLAAGGHRPSVVARGDHLAAIRADGLTLIEGGETTRWPVAASADAADFGEQDYVLLTLKAHSIAGALDAIAPLLGEKTAVVAMQNGMPWWYFHRFGAPFEGRGIDSVDPGRRIWQRLGPERAIGSVVYLAAEVVAPGVIRHAQGRRFVLGEPSGEASDRVTALAGLLEAAALTAPVTDDIRQTIWLKFWGNLSFNPVSVLTGQTLEELANDRDAQVAIRGMMAESQAIGEKLGVDFPVTVDERIAEARGVGPHKTSMLQDYERGRAMEIDALVTVVQELGRMVGIATPTVDTVLALVRSVAIARGCYPAPA
jgi:2-dehydropantoate 2-reductase